MTEMLTPETPAEVEYFMYRVAMAEMLSMLINSGAIALGDATDMLGKLGHKARTLPVAPEVVEYRAMIASHFEMLAERLVGEHGPDR